MYLFWVQKIARSNRATLKKEIQGKCVIEKKWKDEKREKEWSDI